MRIGIGFKRALKRQLIVDDKYWDSGFVLPTKRVELEIDFWGLWGQW